MDVGLLGKLNSIYPDGGGATVDDERDGFGSWRPGLWEVEIIRCVQADGRSERGERDGCTFCGRTLSVKK